MNTPRNTGVAAKRRTTEVRYHALADGSPKENCPPPALNKAALLPSRAFWRSGFHPVGSTVKGVHQVPASLWVSLNPQQLHEETKGNQRKKVPLTVPKPRHAACSALLSRRRIRISAERRCSPRPHLGGEESAFTRPAFLRVFANGFDVCPCRWPPVGRSDRNRGRLHLH